MTNTADPATAAPSARMPWSRKKKAVTGPQGKSLATGTSGLVSDSDWHKPSVRVFLGGTQWLITIGSVIFGLGPLLWLVKAALSKSNDITANPLGWFPSGVAWGNIGYAWSTLDIARYFTNTVLIAIGVLFVQVVTAVTGAYVLSVLRPKWAPYVNGALLATLFVPGIVCLVPLYLEIVDPPLIHTTLINSWLAVWLPAGANAFNIIVIKRFFDSLPREIFEAARVDGAGSVRLLVSVVMPLAKPILSVVSIFAIIGSWKDYLWPLLVLPAPQIQPLSVQLPTIQPLTPQGPFMAALAITTLVPVVMFIVFQRQIMRAQGLGGAIKG